MEILSTKILSIKDILLLITGFLLVQSFATEGIFAKIVYKFMDIIFTIIKKVLRIKEKK